MTNAIDLVRTLYDAFGAGDVKTVLENLDPGIEWVSNGDPNTIPWSGRRVGLAGATSFFEALGGSMDFEVFEPALFLPSGGTVTVVGRTRARHKKGGRGVFECEWVHIFTAKDGKLVRFQEFYDTAAIERALAA